MSPALSAWRYPKGADGAALVIGAGYFLPTLLASSFAFDSASSAAAEDSWASSTDCSLAARSVTEREMVCAAVSCSFARGDAHAERRRGMIISA